MAKELGLDNPASFTDHCFRRFSATEAAFKGTTTVDLKRHYGWVQDKTTLKYVDGANERS